MFTCDSATKAADKKIFLFYQALLKGATKAKSEDGTEETLIEVVRKMVLIRSVAVVEGGQLSRMQSAEKC